MSARSIRPFLQLIFSVLSTITLVMVLLYPCEKLSILFLMTTLATLPFIFFKVNESEFFLRLCKRCLLCSNHINPASDSSRQHGWVDTVYAKLQYFCNQRHQYARLDCVLRAMQPCAGAFVCSGKSTRTLRIACFANAIIMFTGFVGYLLNNFMILVCTMNIGLGGAGLLIIICFIKYFKNYSMTSLSGK